MLNLREWQAELDQSLCIAASFFVLCCLNVIRVLEVNLVRVFEEKVLSDHASSHDVARVSSRLKHNTVLMRLKNDIIEL